MAWSSTCADARNHWYLSQSPRSHDCSTFHRVHNLSCEALKANCKNVHIMSNMHWKNCSRIVRLIVACATIAAVLAVGCSTGGKGAKHSSQCIRINANGSAV